MSPANWGLQSRGAVSLAHDGDPVRSLSAAAVGVGLSGEDASDRSAAGVVQRDVSALREGGDTWGGIADEPGPVTSTPRS